MKLRRLNIKQLPGIAKEFALDDLATGLNVILGPNASGKSSLCRAVRAMLFDEEVRGRVDLAARLEDAQGSLEVTRQGPQILWSRDGQEVAAPSLPEGRLASCFTVHLEDLLSEGETGKEIRERIGKILAGGYDLENIRQSDRFLVKPQHGGTENKALRAAKRTLEEARGRQTALRNHEQRLEELRERKRQAGLEANRIVPLTTARELLVHRQSIQAIDLEVSDYPTGMKKLVGNEATRLEDLRSTLGTHQERLREAEGEQQNAIAELERTGLEDGEPDEAAFGERRETLKTLRGVEKNREAADASLSEARRALKEAVDELGGEQPAEQTRITPDALRCAEEGLQSRRELTAEERATDKLLGKLVPAMPRDEEFEQTRKAQAALGQWLDSSDESEPSKFVKWPWVLIGSLAGIAGITLAALHVHWAFAFLALAVLIAGIVILRRPVATVDPRTKAQSAYRSTNLDEPAEWATDEVTRRSTELESILDSYRQASNDAIRRKDLEREREALRSTLSETDEKLRELSREVGFDPTTLDAGFERWLRLMDSYDRARSDLAGCEVRRAGLVEKEQDLRSDLTAFLGRFGESPDTDDAGADRIESRLRHLEERRGRHDLARKTLNKARRDCKAIGADIERTEKQIARVYEQAGLMPGDDVELARRLDLLQDWKEVLDRRSTQNGKVLATEQRLGEEPKLLALVDRNDDNELRRLLGEAEEIAGRQEQLALEINEIEGSVQRASAGDELRTAREAVSRHKDRLNRRMEEEQFAAAAGFLLAGVEKEHVSAARPEVLRRAENWFASFTRESFVLNSPSSATATFRIRETATGQDRTPAELSSGTRMQLFLALRLAFLEEVEKDREPLPVFLDEALTISDPERFRAVVDCLDSIAREQGRQIFYLTSQPHDVRALTDQVDGVEPILLHRVRDLASAMEDPAELDLPPVEEIPSSEGRTPEEYGVLLRVPPVSLWGEATDIHLFHLLRDDLGLLERLLNHGIVRVGQLHSLLDSGRAAVFLNDGEQADLRWRTSLVDACLEACRHGRGQPVDRQALVDSRISAKFVEKFVPLAAELDGDAKSLLDAIDAKEDKRVKRFRGDQRTLLEAFLDENGHLVDGPPLGRREIELRVQHAATADVERGTTTQTKVAEVTRFLLATALPD